MVGLNQSENNKVVVRILRDDATDAERLKFLQEATPHKIKAKNGNHLVLGLVAACIKMDPLLLIFESSPWVSNTIDCMADEPCTRNIWRLTNCFQSIKMLAVFWCPFKFTCFASAPIV